MKRAFRVQNDSKIYFLEFLDGNIIKLAYNTNITVTNFYLLGQNPRYNGYKSHQFNSNYFSFNTNIG